MSATAVTILLSVVSLIGVLAVGILVPLYLVGRAEKDRREDALEAARLHREDREAEWRRQDALTARATAAAERLLAAQEEESARVVRAHQETSDKLDVIHTLVNSNLTAAMQSEYEAIGRELIMMGEVLEMRRAAGQEPSPGALDAIAATEAKLGELDHALAERRRVQDSLDQKRKDGPP